MKLKLDPRVKEYVNSAKTKFSVKQFVAGFILSIVGYLFGNGFISGVFNNPQSTDCTTVYIQHYRGKKDSEWMTDFMSLVKDDMKENMMVDGDKKVLSFSYSTCKD